jgi:hypothetical protein
LKDRSILSFQAFITGASLSDHPGRTLREHLNTKLHERSVSNENLITEAMRTGGIIGLMEKKSQSDRELNRQYFAVLIKSLHYHVNHYMAKSQLPDFINFLSNELNENVTTQFFAKHRSSSYGCYLSCESIEELLTAYSMYCLQKTNQSLKNAEVGTYFSDDSEAYNDSDEMISFMTWVDPKQVLGTIQPYMFINIRSVAPPPGAEAVPGDQAQTHFGAKALYSAMKKLLNEADIKQELVKFICFDGTNTMSGERGGVQALWRKDFPATIYINCRNHRLALVFVHLKKKFPLISQFDQLLLDIYLAIDYSKVAKLMFKHIQAIVGENPLQIVKACLTRWLTHFRAADRVLEKYDNLLDVFDSCYLKTKDTKYQEVNQRLSDPENVCILVLMREVMRESNQLSMVLQCTTVQFSKVLEMVSLLKSHIEELPTSETYKEKCRIFLGQAEAYQKASAVFLRQTRANNLEKKWPFDSANFTDKFVKPICSVLCEELESAFYDALHPVVGSLSTLILGPVSSPLTDGHHLGNATVEVHLNRVFELYQRDLVGDVSLELLIHEYQKFMKHLTIMKKRHIAQKEEEITYTTGKLKKKKEERAKTPRSVPQYVIKDMEKELTNLGDAKQLKPQDVMAWMIRDELKPLYPNMWYLMSLCSILPLSNAISERGFSYMKLLCATNQGSMKSETLDKTLRIRLFPQGLALTDQAISDITDMFNTQFNKKRHILL